MAIEKEYKTQFGENWPSAYWKIKSLTLRIYNIDRMRIENDIFVSIGKDKSIYPGVVLEIWKDKASKDLGLNSVVIDFGLTGEIDISTTDTALTTAYNLMMTTNNLPTFGGKKV